MLDALGNVPLKLYDVSFDNIDAIADQSWMPPMHLTEEERAVVEAKGTVLLLGRSGTGKTIVSTVILRP
jgi:DNA-binding NtrC family response regulator